MKRRLNRILAASDPLKYDAALTAFHYLYEIPVEIGAKYFDQAVPGWARLVDLDNFNMSYTSSDILAQIYRVDSMETSEYREWSDRILRAHGILSAYGDPNGYDSLTLAWRTQILNRRNGVGQ